MAARWLSRRGPEEKGRFFFEKRKKILVFLGAKALTAAAASHYLCGCFFFDFFPRTPRNGGGWAGKKRAASTSPRPWDCRRDARRRRRRADIGSKGRGGRGPPHGAAGNPPLIGFYRGFVKKTGSHGCRLKKRPPRAADKNP